MLKEKNLKKLNDAILSIRENIHPSFYFVSITVLIFYIFFPFFNQIIIKHFILFFQNCESTSPNDIIFTIFFAVAIIYLIWKILNKSWYITIVRYLYCLPVLVIFIMHRFLIEEFQRWHFINFNFFSPLKYIDVIFFLFIIYILNPSKRKKIPSPNSTKLFLEDDHSTFNNLDLLKREQFSIEIAEYISNTTPNNAFAIGVVGKWGSGKSVFLNQLENALLDKAIVIKFNAWRSRDSKQILEDFFYTLTNELRNYNVELSNQIHRYSHAILALDDSFLGKFFNPFIELIFPQLPLAEQYSRIKRLIETMQSKIIVFIDDIDRLDELEVLEVLRIVRNTANFPNIFFVLAFDHDYVENALKQSKIPSPNSYMEKVFQLEITLPSYPYSILFNKQIELLNTGKSEEEQQKILEAFKQVVHTIQEPVLVHKQINLFKDYILSLRDVVRYTNSFNLTYHLKKGDVDLVDFIVLELIRLKYYAVYNLIVEQLVLDQFESFLDIDDTKSISQNLNIVFKSKDFEVYMEEKLFYKKDIDLLSKTLDFLFNRSRNSVLHRAISNPSNSLIYLSNDLFSQISLTQFNSVRTESKFKFLHQIDEWVYHDKKEDLFHLFIKSNLFDNRRVFENTIHGMIYLLSKEDFPYLKANIFEKLKKVKVIISRYYNDSLVEYKNFLKSLISIANYPFVIESDIFVQFLKSIIYYQDTDLEGMLGKDEVLELILSLFDKFVDQENVVDLNAFMHYYNCIDDIDLNSNVTLSKNANLLFRKLIDKNPLSYIKKLIRPLSAHDDREVYTLEPFIKQTFNGYQNFSSFLDSNEPTLESLEVKTFFRKYIRNGEKGLEFTRGNIEYISDESLIFLESKKYPGILKNTNAVKFFHPTYSEKLISQYDDFGYSNWVAHIKPEDLDSDQASNGGDYKLKYNFFIPFEIKNKKAKLLFAVDDSCNIDINGKKTFTNVITFPDNAQELNILLQSGENYLIFEIFNTDSVGVGQPAGSTIQGIENPYGVIFIIKVEADI